MQNEGARAAIPSARRTPHPGLSFNAFVGLIAALMAVNALAVDAMLPALPDIGAALHIATENERQLIVTVYLLGLGLAQIFFGPLSDRFGRKPPLLFGLGLYVVAGFIATTAHDFHFMLAARVVQGIGAAATRVLAISIIRDCYSGRQMAKVVSLAMIVFLTVPIIAPSMGQAIAFATSWRWIFGFLTVFATLLAVTVALRLPETLRPGDRRSLAPRSFVSGVRTVVTNRTAIGYIVAMTLLMGSLFGFINCAQQVFADVFPAQRLFPLIFAAIASGMAAASLVNARYVGRVGMRRMCHGAMIGYIALSCLHLVVVLADLETIWRFTLLQAGMMFCFGLIVGNFGAITMEPLGHLAGIGSSVQGFVTTAGGALIGFAIGQLFNGTIVPLIVGFTACGLAAAAAVLFAERGKLFRPTV